MSNTLFYGCGVALVTPFCEGRVDCDALEKLIDWQVDSGIDALIVLGTTGEPSTITEPERGAIIECALARAAHRVPVIVGVGSNDTRTAARLAREAQRMGADGVLAVTPYYNRASRAGLAAHFRAIADAAELPVIMYNVPSRTGVNLPPDLIAELAKHPNLCGIKEASGNLSQMVDLAAACGGGVAVYSGNDDQVLAAMALGARGVISVAANVVPSEMRALTGAWLKGDVERCRQLQYRLLPLIRRLFDEVSPIPVKAALSMMGRIENDLRLPLVSLDDAKAANLRWELQKLGILAPREGE